MRVLVTAGCSGIGEAIAAAFIENGASVHVCDIDPRAIENFKQIHPSASVTLCDVGVAAEMDRLFSDVDVKLGGLDVLVNNAGLSGPRAPIEEISEQDWNECVAVNLNGPFMAIRRAAPAMKTQRSGCIINIVTASVRTGLPMRTPYVVTKTGLLGLTRNAARELGPSNIRCNAVLPGLIDNARGRALVRLYADKHKLEFDDAMHHFLSYISMRTMISPREVADTCVFLASPAARHITGQEIGVDGYFEWEI